MNLSRRRFLIGASAVAVTAVVKANVPASARPPLSYVYEQPEWVPDGWLLPNGQPVSRLAYPRLFAALGHQSGGDGATSFNLPDLGGFIHYRGPGTFGIANLIATDTAEHGVPGQIAAFAVPQPEA